MSGPGTISAEAARKVLLENGDGPALADLDAPRSGTEGDRRLGTDEENAADDLVRLVLALVDTVRQLMEKQAIRRVESGKLSEDEIERLGLTLMRLEERMAELKERFGMTGDDMSLRLGTVGDLMDILDEDPPEGARDGSGLATGRRTERVTGDE